MGMDKRMVEIPKSIIVFRNSCHWSFGLFSTKYKIYQFLMECEGHLNISIIGCNSGINLLLRRGYRLDKKVISDIY